ncbi:hypothetical protein ACC689_29120 [Rhizobium ruizarguesonis]
MKQQTSSSSEENASGHWQENALKRQGFRRGAGPGIQQGFSKCPNITFPR